MRGDKDHIDREREREQQLMDAKRNNNCFYLNRQENLMKNLTYFSLFGFLSFRPYMMDDGMNPFLIIV